MTISGKRIVQERIKQKLSQEELADEVGVSQSIISAWESGHNKVSGKYFEKLAETLKVELIELLDEASVSVYHQHGTSGPNSVNGNGNTVIAETQKLTEELLSTQRKLIASLEAAHTTKDQTIAELRAEIERLRSN